MFPRRNNFRTLPRLNDTKRNFPRPSRPPERIGMTTVRQSLRPYTGAPAAVSRDTFAFAPAPRVRPQPRTRRRSSRTFLAALLAVTAGWIFAAANPGNLAALAARVGSLAMGYGAPGVEIVRTEARRTVLDGQTILY